MIENPIKLISRVKSDYEWFVLNTELHSEKDSAFYVGVIFTIKENLESCSFMLPTLDGTGKIEFTISGSRFVLGNFTKEYQKVCIPKHNGTYNQVLYAPDMVTATQKYTNIHMLFHDFSSVYQKYLEEKPDRCRFTALEFI